MTRPTVSEVLRIFDATWQDAIWLSIWMFVFVGMYTAVLLGYAYIWARRMFIKNELPRIYKGKLKRMLDENKSLKSENRVLKEERRNLSERLDVIRNSAEVKR